MDWFRKQVPKFKIREVLSSPPRRYWNKFLLLLALLALGILAADGWVFLTFSLPAPGKDISGEAAVETLDKNALGRVFETLDQKAADFELFRLRGGVEDPS